MKKSRFSEDGMDASRPLWGTMTACSDQGDTMPTTVGLNIAKRFFQLHTVDPETGEIRKVKLRRAEVIPFFANHAASIIAREVRLINGMQLQSHALLMHRPYGPADLKHEPALIAEKRPGIRTTSANKLMDEVRNEWPKISPFKRRTYSRRA